MRRLLLLSLFASSLAWGGQGEGGAGEVQVHVRPDSLKATVGDRIVIQVEVVRPGGVTYDPPVPESGKEGTLTVEPLILSSAGKEQPKDVFYFQAQAFETGKVEIPSFQVAWKKQGGAGGVAASQPVSMEIVSVLKDEKEKPADLKPPAEIPSPPFPWRWALLIAGGALLAAYLLKRFWRRKPAAQPPPAPAVKIPPHELAYRELERLLAGSLLREGKIKEFHVELSEIVKRYLGARFDLVTLERTSYEVLQDLKQVRIEAEPLATTREFLGETDLVKFAKYRPAEDEIRRNVDRAYRLVDSTKLAAARPEPGGTEAGAASLATGSAG